LTYVGELRPHKGLLDLVDAFDKVVPSLPNARLRIVGDGELGPALRQFADSRPWLELAGKRDRSEIPDLLRASRAVAVTPKSDPRFRERWAEQFGFALVEAMACGLPVVTTRCGAIPEVIPEWNPTLDEGDVDSIAGAILHVLGPAGDAIGARNRDFAVDRYDARRQGVRMQQAIEQLLDMTR
jgi:glycosyltransferase involved in cell wall biosynthesis